MFARVKSYLAQQYQSLIFRILLYFLISAIAVALVLGWSFVNRIKPRFNNEILPNLSQYIHYLVQDIGTPPDIKKAELLTDKLPFELRIEGEGVNWSSTSTLASIATYQFSQAPYPYQDYAINRHSRETLLLLEVGEFRYLFSVDNSFRSGSRYRHWFLFLLLGGILVVLYLAIRRLFNPVRHISQQLAKIGAGQLDQPMQVTGKGELAQLSHGINKMTLDIKTMLEGKASLLLAISHELRSPITRMRINLELLEDVGKRQVLIEDIQEMEELVSGILESERLNTRHAKLNRVNFDMAEMINEIIEQQFASCLISQKLSPMQVNLDEVRIRLLVRNLIENACRYSADIDKSVEVDLESDSNYLIFRVVDYGPGVETEDLPHLTEPFYRADSARLRKTGGYGLGLYLCRLIVEAHDGQLELQSESGSGMTVIARLPQG